MRLTRARLVSQTSIGWASAAFGILALVVATGGAPEAAATSAGVEAPEPTARVANTPRVASAILAGTNALRREQGRVRVTSEAHLAQAAADFAAFMARTDQYGHRADGQGPEERAARHGYAYCIVAENLAYQLDSQGFGTDELAQRFVDGWTHSPEHRRNMLDADVTDTGVAVARGTASGKYYAVQLFGRPESAGIEFVLENRTNETVTYAVDGERFVLEPRVIRTQSRCRAVDQVVHRPN
jgi:uncharacterized protein YkwD